jgi:hypothetical protein
MSLYDILQIERERVIRERVVLTTVYDRMKNRINNSVRVKAKECVYTIPEFIPGYPLINVEKTMNYLLTKLKKEGFIVIQLTLFDLYITWDPIKIRQLDQQVKPIEPKKEEPLYSKIDRNKQLWTSNDHGQNKNVEKKLIEKEFERANEDFINSLIVSKKNDKKSS